MLGKSRTMVRPRSIRLFIAALVLFCGKTQCFSPLVFRKHEFARAKAKIVAKKVNDGSTHRNEWRKSSRLTSTYIEARHRNRLKSIQSMMRAAAAMPLKYAKRLQKNPQVQRILIGIILGSIVILGPAFSPAHASTVASTVATAASGASNIQPFPIKSRALGTFSLLPSKAELEFSFRLVYAACSAAFVGLERSSADRPAGVRTMALVGLGSCMYTISSVHGFLPHSALGYAPGSPMLEGVKCDPSRMAANIASGVGFIGAGMFTI
jgi:hypothetical protein